MKRMLLLPVLLWGTLMAQLPEFTSADGRYAFQSDLGPSGCSIQPDSRVYLPDVPASVNLWVPDTVKPKEIQCRAVVADRRTGDPVPFAKIYLHRLKDTPRLSPTHTPPSQPAASPHLSARGQGWIRSRRPDQNPAPLWMLAPQAEARMPATCTLLSESWDNGTWQTANWQLNGFPTNVWIVNTAAGGQNGTQAAYISDGSGAGSAYSYTDLIGSPASQYSILYKNINATNLSSLNLSFYYKVVGEGPDGFGGPYDYFDLVYSTNGGTSWTALTTAAYNVPGWTQFSGTLPASLNNTSFLLGWRWTSDDYIVNNPPVALDNILLTATFSPSAGPDQSICLGGSGVTLTASGAASYTWTPAAGLSCTSCASPLATPTTTTTYTVTAQQGVCSATDQVTVTVNSAVANAGPDATICNGQSTFLNGTGTSPVWSPAAGLSCTACANPTATPATTTDYVLTVTSGTCTDTDTLTITVNQGPPVVTGPGGTLCAGDSLQLSASGASAWDWQPAASLNGAQTATPVAFPATTTTYTVTGTGANGCTTQASVTVTVNTQPDASFTASNDTIVAGQTVNFTWTGSNATSWTWNFGDGGSSNFASPGHPFLTPGDYGVTLTTSVAGSPCTDTYTVFIHVMAPVAAADVYARGVTVYPVPAGQVFRLRGLSGVEHLALTDMAGRMLPLTWEPLTNGEVQVRVSGQVAAGTYLLQGMAAGQAFRTRVHLEP